MQDMCQFLVRSLFIILAASLIASHARHLGDENLDDNNQFGGDLETNQLVTGLKPLQLELLAQKLAMAELNNNQLRYPEYAQESDPQAIRLADILFPGDGFQRNLRSNSKNRYQGKRGSKCFFNAVSCFGKK
ncbi:uncharacterized protein LOC126885167 [Diabrotica virgifera virgifera]|uniref:Uncharacterized protein n=1 Tax=Diabrotica virgifera virgifera TaxID=50390 RepID=A0ABM5KBH6_DIAVI|nr:uncharacterized protein LOC126885167 [Diabrotica virgifera virgifera]XP_050507546.1 uncharacterized protein LOC126885167 [Diabrotica virgifera virgifera]